jgi:hypothetical protein
MINLFRKCTGIIGVFICMMLTLSLTGCGAGRTMVIAPVETPVKFTSAELYEDRATVNVPGDFSASSIFPMGYVTSAGTKDLVSPKLVKRSMGRYAAPKVAETAAVLMGVPGVNYLAFAAATAWVAYLPVGLIVGAIAGKSAEKKWQPCLQELAQEIKEIDPAAALQSKLDERLKKFHAAKTVALPPEGDPFQVAGQQGLKSLLQVEVQRLQIRECQERTFCVEVAIRARLWKLPDKSLYLDKALAYTGTRPDEPLPSEIQVPYPFPCRTMEDYCGPSGRQIFREEIAAANSNLVHQLLTEVGL